jgi:hypothetical protein
MENDWLIFRKRIPEWRERFLSKKTIELSAILTDESKSPTERFWEVERQIGGLAKVLQDSFDGHSRTSMPFHLKLMLGHGMIEKEDLDEFSAQISKMVLMD